MHVLGARQRVTRKVIHKGQWTVFARLQLGAASAVLGVPASAFAGRTVPVEDVWGAVEAQHVYDRLAAAANAHEAALILERVIAERLSLENVRRDHSSLACEAAMRLPNANVSEVAADLGMSERHFRRVFLETVGVSPKTFARLVRFARATDLARTSGRAGWASIAAQAGYYDQAHLIDEFRAFAGATPDAFLRELNRMTSRTGNLRASQPLSTTDETLSAAAERVHR